MFTGEYEHIVDSKNRIFVPVKFREELGETFIVARDIRKPILKVCSLVEWENYLAPIKAQERKIAEEALRYLHRNASQVSPDSQGRILIPTSLLGYAEIEREAIFVGCSDYCEIWSAEKYRADVLSEDPEDIREKLERLGL
ncbi:MAG: cell division/cell wall cluster transcriptional repressor MraZ [Clostridia bacterium]|nr:cell division/cell wall cluster transcriptional repressor MraZ [Oscillospiraceae bacterium]MBQ7830352.1 cell division/cell wall cluster transcriptional repressor MraZ [Clostridia bacterium]